MGGARIETWSAVFTWPGIYCIHHNQLSACMSGCLGIMNNIFKKPGRNSTFARVGQPESRETTYSSPTTTTYYFFVVDGIMSTQYVDSRHKVCSSGALIGS